MRLHDRGSRKRRRFRVVTTDSKPSGCCKRSRTRFPGHRAEPEVAGEPDRHPTDEGWLYLAVVLDLFSRKLVGWAMSATMPQELTLAALAVALGWRNPAPVGHLTRIAGRNTPPGTLARFSGRAG